MDGKEMLKELNETVKVIKSIRDFHNGQKKAYYLRLDKGSMLYVEDYLIHKGIWTGLCLALNIIGTCMDGVLRENTK